MKRVGLVAFFLAFLLPALPAGAPVVRQVLMLQSFERGVMIFDLNTADFRAGLDALSKEPVTVSQIAIAPSGLRDAPERAVIDYLLSAFPRPFKPDLIVTVGGPAAAFARKHRTELFPDVPMLYAFTDVRFVAGPPLSDNETVFASEADFPRIVDDIRQVLPRTKTVFLVTGAGQLARLWRKELEPAFERFRGQLTFEWSDDLGYRQMLERAAALPPDSAILYIASGADADLGWHSTEQTLKDLSALGTAPLFGLHSPWIGLGPVGGTLIHTETAGRTAAEAAIRILQGELPGSIKIPVQKQDFAVFDARQLQRWKISETRLPANSRILFKEPSAWDAYRSYILGGGLILLLQTTLIVGLVIQRTWRRRAERELRHSYEQNQDLAGRLIHAQEDERARIARDLHDDLSQRLAGLAIMLSGLKRKVGKPGAEADLEQAVTALQEGTAEAAATIRTLSHELHPSVLEHSGLTATLQRHCAEIERHHSVAVKFTPAAGLDALDSAVALCLYRVVQEALTNAVRHARARSIAVGFTMAPARVELTVADDGVGFEAGERTRSGLGLRSIRERVRFLKGDVSVDSRPGAGTRVLVQIPIG